MPAKTPVPPRPDPDSKASCVRLILGDQLNAAHPWFQDRDSSTLYVMMELRCESEYVTHHIQKIAGVFAAMRAFANALHQRGHRVHYLRITDPDNAHTFKDNLKTLIQNYQACSLEYQEPDEYRLDVVLSKLSTQMEIPCSCVDTNHFLTTRTCVGEFFSGKKVWRMENFYRAMRKRHKILLDARGGPLGERWNFDAENRNRLPKDAIVPEPLEFGNDVSQVIKDIHAAKLPYIGQIDAQNYGWATTRKQALKLLGDFVTVRLAHFGRFQDALSDRHWALYHSRLSQALNLKIISPAQVIRAAIEHWNQHQDSISLPQIEGFVRQILGWREYIRGIYWHHMPSYAEQNALNHQRDLPDFFWTGDTKMRCVAQAIKQSLEHGYAHHIQRLMVTGNFCGLAGVEPSQVDQWYLGIYVDAFEWVELPNTRGMSQYADAGLLASKPYVSSANYLQKMGDHCKSCSYNPKSRTEADACPFNSLYWHYLTRHEAMMRKNPRMSMMYRQLDKLKDKDKVLARAQYCLDHMDAL